LRHIGQMFRVSASSAVLQAMVVVVRLCATKMRAPMWCEGVPAGVCVYGSLNLVVVCCSVQGRVFTVVGVGVVWCSLRRVGGGVDVRVQMWAAGAAADHSSARVHDSSTSEQHYSCSRARSIPIRQLKYCYVGYI